MCIRHPKEPTDDCLLYRWNTDLGYWEYWNNYGWSKSQTYSGVDKFSGPKDSSVNSYDNRKVSYESTWAEPYEEEL